jgi:hypothetical protein
MTPIKELAAEVCRNWKLDKERLCTTIECAMVEALRKQKDEILEVVQEHLLCKKPHIYYDGFGTCADEIMNKLLQQEKDDEFRGHKPNSVDKHDPTRTLLVDKSSPETEDVCKHEDCISSDIEVEYFGEWCDKHNCHRYACEYWKQKLEAIRADERAKFAKSHVAEIEQQLRDGLGLEYANKGYQKALNDVLELGKKEILGCNETHDEDTASTIWWFLEKIKALQGGKT